MKVGNPRSSSVFEFLAATVGARRAVALPLLLFLQSTSLVHAVYIRAWAEPNPVILGNKFALVCEVNNDTGINQSDMVVTNTLPGNAVFVSAVITNGTYEITNSTFLFHVGDLPPGTQTTYQIVMSPVTGRLATNYVHWRGKGDPYAQHFFCVVDINPAAPIAEMTIPRGGGHDAITLLDGRVLISGGQQVVYPVATAEVYIPAEERFIAVGSMKHARAHHRSTLLRDGKVLLAGGSAVRDYFDPVLGHWVHVTSVLEVFDPAVGRFEEVGTLQIGRGGHSLTVLGNGDILLAGGAGTNTLVERLHQENGVWVVSSAGHLLYGRTWHAAALRSDGRVLFAGGVEGGAPYEIFDPATGISSPVPNPDPELPAAVASGGKILLHASAVHKAACYDVESLTLTPISAPARGPNPHYLVLRNGNVLMTGGAWEPTAAIFDLRAATYTPTFPISQGRNQHTSAELADGRVLLCGGYVNFLAMYVASSEIYAFRLDADFDGMDDDWELANGLNPARRQDATEDADGEGHTNLQEFLAGTDPRNPAHVLKLAPPRILNGSVLIRFDSKQGKYYRLERCAEPQSNAWTTVADSIAGTGASIEIQDPLDSDGTPQFYRVMLLR